MTERRVTAEERRYVTERARECCEYCRSQLRFAMQAFSVEHVEPRSREGETEIDNLALSCQGCNNHKYTKTEGRDPITGERTPLYNPRRQKWSDHFCWSADFTQVIGLTSTGRATVEVLQLNRVGLVNLRSVLYAAGEHPPSQATS